MSLGGEKGRLRIANRNLEINTEISVIFVTRKDTLLRTASSTALENLTEEIEMIDIGEMTETTGIEIEIGEEIETETGTEMTTGIANIADVLTPAPPVVPIVNVVEMTTGVGTEKERDTHLKRGVTIPPLVADIDRHNLTHITPCA